MNWSGEHRKRKKEGRIKTFMWSWVWSSSIWTLPQPPKLVLGDGSAWTRLRNDKTLGNSVANRDRSDNTIIFPLPMFLRILRILNAACWIHPILTRHSGNTTCDGKMKRREKKNQWTAIIRNAFAHALAHSCCQPLPTPLGPNKRIGLTHRQFMSLFIVFL